MLGLKLNRVSKKGPDDTNNHIEWVIWILRLGVGIQKVLQTKQKLFAILVWNLPMRNFVKNFCVSTHQNIIKILPGCINQRTLHDYVMK